MYFLAVIFLCKYNYANVYLQVKQIEKRDSVLTSKQQIDRLLRPGSTYFNLNPFEVSRLSLESMLKLKLKFMYLNVLFVLSTPGSLRLASYILAKNIF